MIHSQPESGSIGVVTDVVFRIRFDEWVDRARTTADTYLSPWFEPGLETHWSGKELVIRPREPLPTGRTWLLEIGTGCRDLAGNPLAEPFQLLFSTGTTIDRGAVHGTVIGAKETANVQVWAWPAAETPRRAFAESPWRTRIDATGSFRLEALPEGEYFLLAVEDADHDARWDFLSESAAVPQRACNTADPLPLRLRLSPDLGLDSLSLKSVIAPDPWHLLLRAVLEPVQDRGVRVTDPEHLKRLRKQQLRAYHADGHQLILLDLAAVGDQWLLETTRMDSLGGFLLAPAIGDTLQIPPAMADTVIAPFAGLPPQKTDEAGVLEWLPRRAVHVDSSLRAHLFQSDDSLGRELLPESGGGLRLRWQLGDSLRQARLELPAGLLRLADGGLWPDSLLTLQIQSPPRVSRKHTGDVQLLIPGMVDDRRRQGWVLVSRQGGEVVRQDPLHDEELLLENVPEGFLTFSLFQDRNRDTQWNPGIVSPFAAAEPWIQLADTVEVIAGWRQERKVLHSPEEWE